MQLNGLRKDQFVADSGLEEGRFEPLVPPQSQHNRGNRPDVANRQHPSWISNPSCQFNQHLCRKWDQRFESAFLQRRVCKPSVPRDAGA